MYRCIASDFKGYYQLQTQEYLCQETKFKLLLKLLDVCLTRGFTLRCDSLIRWHDRLQVSDDRLLSEQVDQGQAFDLTDSLDKRKVTFRLWVDGK